LLASSRSRDEVYDLGLATTRRSGPLRKDMSEEVIEPSGGRGRATVEGAQGPLLRAGHLGRQRPVHPGGCGLDFVTDTVVEALREAGADTNMDFEPITEVRQTAVRPPGSVRLAGWRSCPRARIERAA